MGGAEPERNSPGSATNRQTSLKLFTTGARNYRRTQIEETQRRLNGVLSAIQQAGLVSTSGNAAGPTQRAPTIHVIGLNWAIISPGGEPCGFPEKLRVADLFRDAEAASGQDPTSVEGQSIATRYRRLLARQCQGNPACWHPRWTCTGGFPSLPDGLGLDSRLENFSNKAWVFIGKALDASRS